MTLFTKSMAPSDDLEDDFDAVDLVFDGRDPDGSMSMCTIKKSDEEFDYFVGFNPVLEVSERSKYNCGSGRTKRSLKRNTFFSLKMRRIR